MKVLKKLWNRLIDVENIILFVASAALIVMIFSSVVMRYVLKVNYVGLEEISTLIAFWIYFVGGAKCSLEESHISADLISVMMPENKFKKIFVLIRSLILAVLFAIATYFSIDLITYAIESGKSTISLHIPYQYMYASIPIGLGLMLMYSIYHFLMNVRKLRK